MNNLRDNLHHNYPEKYPKTHHSSSDKTYPVSSQKFKQMFCKNLTAAIYVYI